jgi:hypothetical protein
MRNMPDNTDLLDNAIEHAWLIRDLQVYDTNSNRFWSWDEYSIKYKARIRTRYTRAKAMEIGALHQHYGPWDSDSTG